MYCTDVAYTRYMFNGLRIYPVFWGTSWALQKMAEPTEMPFNRGRLDKYD